MEWGKKEQIPKPVLRKTGKVIPYSTEMGPVPLIDIGDEEQKDILIENAKQKARALFWGETATTSEEISSSNCFPFPK